MRPVARRLAGHLAAAASALVLLGACVPGEGLPLGQGLGLGQEQGAETSAPPVSGDLERQTAQVHRDLAAGLEAAGEAEAAVAELERAIEAESRARTADRLNAERQIEAAGDDLSGSSYGELERLCKRNDPPAQAVRACTLMIAQFRVSAGRLPELLTDRGDAYRALGDPGRAEGDYSAALKVDGSFARALLARARVRAGLEDLPGSARDYRRAIGAGETAPEIRTERAEVLMQAGLPGPAIEEYDRILADPDQPGAHSAAYLGRAQAHCADGQADASAIDWQVWLAGAPGESSRLARPLINGGYLETAAEPLAMEGETLEALRAWTADGCPETETAPPETAPEALQEASPEAPAETLPAEAAAAPVTPTDSPAADATDRPAAEPATEPAPNPAPEGQTSPPADPEQPLPAADAG